MRQAASGSNDPAPQARILIVDDNKHGLAARRQVLEELGYSVCTTNSPVDGLALFLKETFDLIVTDFKMPEMDGLELIVHMRAAKPDIPIVLISGYVDALGLTEESTRSNAVIQKSANEVQQLVRTVNRLLKKNAPRKSARSETSRAPRGKARGA